MTKYDIIIIVKEVKNMGKKHRKTYGKFSAKSIKDFHKEIENKLFGVIE